MMEIIIHGQNMEVTPAIRKCVEKKLGKLTRYFDNIVNVEVHTSTQRSFKTAEVTLNANGHLIRAEERSSDIQLSIDRVFEKLETQIKHYKDRIVDRQRRPQRRQAVSNGERPGTPDTSLAHEPAEEPSPIVRRKQFSLEMMSAEDAVGRMQLLGHDFFLFLNDETHQVNVVYERQDGGFGVLEPSPGSATATI